MTDAPEAQKTAVIVEDDPDVRHLLVEVLEAAGFSTVSVGNGIDGVRAVLAYQPLITTLDVNMPGIDGFEAARRIREKSNTFIIMLTGLADEADVVLGLGAGADEYIVKPFRPREFRARVEALLRRPRPVAGNGTQPRQGAVGPSFPGARQPGETLPGGDAFPAPRDFPAEPAMPNPPAQPTYPAIAPGYAPPQPGYPAQQPAYPAQQPAVAPAPAEATPIIVPAASTGSEVAVPSGSRVAVPGGGYWVTHRDLQLNPETRIVLIAGQEVELTRTEFDLLATLLESKRRVRSKADLTLVLRGESYVTSYYVGEADKRAVEAHMTNLRRKLADNPTNPRYIETVRGVGYRLTTELLAP
ncbi:response regulator transcription factor [Microbacterium sp. SORGH_AS_0888]|uniref:response regulator transcription factor n=1 Tax=Microbacterium sp. SORGH_AS_0888 TaxID=3041791 RepID=UPI002783A24B|nr:response regulator transcription factor [Microbacterium sp. SORGH_AS_0888]MDQ1130383.1 two-component system OmpR family response regulator [Microbacterium sp. SORGH_AS_0888]